MTEKVTMNNLKNRLEALNDRPSVEPCPFSALLQSCDAETAEILEKLVDNHQISTRAIHKELQAEGIKIARETISYHRKGWCRCKGTSE